MYSILYLYIHKFNPVVIKAQILTLTCTLCASFCILLLAPMQPGVSTCLSINYWPSYLKNLCTLYVIK